MPDRGGTANHRIGGVLPPPYRLKTPGYSPVGRCFFCPSNGLLAFKPITHPDIPAYVMPGSLVVQVEGEPKFVPIPFTSLLVPFAHQPFDPAGFGFTFPPGWTGFINRLLPLIPGLDTGAAWEIHSQVGHAAGARVPPAVAEAGITPHPWNWLVYARDLLNEGAIEDSTALGLATLILRARQAAGSLPSDMDLFHLWEICLRHTDDPITRYHRELLRPSA